VGANKTVARGRPSRKTIYTQLESALDDLRARLGGLPSPKEAETIWADIWHLEAHHSTALEGNTLVLREVEALLDTGRAVGSKPLKEYVEVKGYGDAARWVYSQALEPDEWSTDGLISVNEVRRVHRMTMGPVWDVASHEHATDAESPGNFRRHDIRPFAEGMTPPSWPDVPMLLQDWVDDVVEFGGAIADGRPLAEVLPEALARLHNRFEQIHPFLDGNGRTGRLVLNLILVRLGHPPVVIFKRQRDAYLRAMRRADAGDVGPLGEVIARAMFDNLNRFIVPAVAGPARLVPLAALVDEQHTLAALRQAAQRGRLDAIQQADGVWLSSRQAVDAYDQTKYRRRPLTT
jgi:Fic family protein